MAKFKELLLTISAILFISNSLWAVDTYVPLANYKREIKKIFPKTDKVQVDNFIPHMRGGSTFFGLMGYLFGKRLDGVFESRQGRRVLYYAYDGDDLIGAVHGSKTNIYGKKNPVSVFVFYNPDSSINTVRVDGLKAVDTKQLLSTGALTKFHGYKPDDFMKHRRSRRRSSKPDLVRGAFHKAERAPASVGKVWSKVARSVSYNAVFADVAFFSTRSILAKSQKK